METITVNGVIYKVEGDCVRIPGLVNQDIQKKIKKELRKFIKNKYSSSCTL